MIWDRWEGHWRGVDHLVQRADLAALPLPLALTVGGLRGLVGIIREATTGQLNLLAMSLVYTTLLSIVPLLALSFSVLKAFGAHNAIEPFLLSQLEPLGEQGVEIAHQLVGFVDNMQVGVLGFMGLILLVYTVVALVQKIEQAFNGIWQIENSRSWPQRFSNYLSVILVGPLLIVSAFGLSTAVMASPTMQAIIAVPPFGAAADIGSRLVPFLLIVAAFTFIYVFVPNTRVRVWPALVGALVAAVLKHLVGWMFTALVVGSARFDAIYSGFAIVIILLIWIYVIWLILLIGATISFYIQHPECMLARTDAVRISNALRERLGLHLTTLIGRRFLTGAPPLNLEQLAHELQVPARPLLEIVQTLEQRGILIATGHDDEARYMPARDLAEITVSEVLSALRNNAADSLFQRLEGISAVDAVIGNLDSARESVLAQLSLRSLAQSEPKPEAESQT